MKAVIRQRVALCACDDLAARPCRAAGHKLVSLAAGMRWTQPRQAAHWLNSAPQMSGGDGGTAIVSPDYEGGYLGALVCRRISVTSRGNRAAPLLASPAALHRLRLRVRQALPGIRTWRHGASAAVTSAIGAAVRPRGQCEDGPHLQLKALSMMPSSPSVRIPA